MHFAAAPLIVTPPPATPCLFINEQRVDASCAGGWDQMKRRLQISSANLTCSTVAIQADNVVMALPNGGAMELTGDLKYQANLAFFGQWIRNPAVQATWNISGSLTGTAQAQQSNGVISGATSAEIVSLTVIDAMNQRVSEPSVKLSAAGNYDPKTKVMQMDKFELTSSALAIGAAGKVNAQNEADFNGQVAYDLNILTGLLSPYLGPKIHATGRGTSTASYQGPLSLASSPRRRT